MRIKLQPQQSRGLAGQGDQPLVQGLPLPEPFQGREDGRRPRTLCESVEKARDLDPHYPEPYSWLSVIYKSVLAKLEP